MNLIFEIFRYFVFTLFSIINAVLCSAMIVEISVDNTLLWESIPSTTSFKWLVFTIIIMVITFIIDYFMRKKNYNSLKQSAIESIKSANVYDTIAEEMNNAVRTNNTKKFDTLTTFMDKIGRLDK